MFYKNRLPALPMSRSPAPVTSDQAASFSSGDLVILHPWHLLDQYEGNVYAKVTKCEGNNLFVRTRAVLGINPYPATVLRLDLSNGVPRKVSSVEVNGLQTGKNMFKACMFEYANEFMHGQVVDYTNRPAMVEVETKSGRIAVSLSEVTELPPPLAFLFYAQAWKTEEWSRERMMEAHRTVLDRLREFDLTNRIESLLEYAFQGIGPPPREPLYWMNTAEGERNLCRPEHAALFVRLSENWQLAPASLTELVGDQWCADPAALAVEAGQPELTEPQQDEHEPATASPLRATVTQSPISYVTSSKPKRSAKALFSEPVPRQDARLEPLPEDVIPFPDEEEDQDEWDEAMSQTSEAVNRCLGNQNTGTTLKPSLRTLLGLTDASFHDNGRKAKKIHYPTPLNNIMARAFHSDECNRMDAQSLIESFSGARYPWNVHPYMSIKLRNAQFGPIGVRGFMFRKVEERERRSWTLEHAEHLQDYGEHCKVFELPPLKTKQELVEAYGNLTYYWSQNGSTLAKTFGAHLQWFISSLQTSDMPTPDAVAAHMEFIDSTLANFARAVIYDARNGTDTHETVHLQLTKTNPELVKELAYLLDDRMRLLEASLSKRKSQDPTPGAVTKKGKKTPPTSSKPKTTVKPHDGSVLHLVGKHEGKSVCLRHLSVSGCFSKDPVKCTSELRIHHVPSEPLRAEVANHIQEKWGGVSPKYPHLVQ